MKLTLKPNRNSARVNTFKSSPHYGLLQYDMVDVMAEGAVWGSIHIDGFCPTNDPAADSALYDRLLAGETVVVEVVAPADTEKPE